ncbi:MAG TPA: helix-turn-helix transcriptional regulator, partial [Acidimicrobiia bacterium]|nr:helix-turn-helix transcriptional regulator [Acidimicrobiia bacterium]
MTSSDNTAAEFAAIVGARVRDLRKARGMSLGALAKATGVGKGTLSELESGRRNPTLATL